MAKEKTVTANEFRTERDKLEKTQNGKKKMNNILMPRSPKNRKKT